MAPLATNTYTVPIQKSRCHYIMLMIRNSDNRLFGIVAMTVIMRVISVITIIENSVNTNTPLFIRLFRGFYSIGEVRRQTSVISILIIIIVILIFLTYYIVTFKHIVSEGLIITEILLYKDIPIRYINMCMRVFVIGD